MYTRKTKLVVVKGEERSLPNLEKVREVVKELDTQEQGIVLTATTEFFRARQAGMLSYLSMGEHLVKVRNVLEPHELWKKYANALPNMGIATAYRMIWAWENAQRALPAGTLRIVARDGYRIISGVKGEMFAPGYKEAVRETVKELGPAPEQEGKAVEWLKAVKEKKRELGKMVKPVDARRNSLTVKVREILARIKRTVAGLPEEQRGAFLDKVGAGVEGLYAKKPSGSVRAA